MQCLQCVSGNASQGHTTHKKLFMLANLAQILLLSSCQPVANSTPADNPTKNPSQSQTATYPANPTAAPVKVLTPDWAVASTLTAMGFPPIATGDIRTYPDWMVDPSLPETVVDIGARFAPNPERFAQLNADVIVDTEFYTHLRPLYGKLPHVTVSFSPKNPIATWADYVEPTRKLGQIIHQPAAAENYLENTHNHLLQLGQSFQQRFPTIKKLAIVQFADSNSLRLYGHNSLFEPTLTAMNLTLQIPDTLGKANAWGYIPITLGDLAKLDKDTCLVVVEPFSPMLQKELTENQLWQRLGYGSNHCMTILPALWTFGGVPSMLTFAQRLNGANFSGQTHAK